MKDRFFFTDLFTRAVMILNVAKKAGANRMTQGTERILDEMIKNPKNWQGQEEPKTTEIKP